MSITQIIFYDLLGLSFVYVWLQWVYFWYRVNYKRFKYGKHSARNEAKRILLNRYIWLGDLNE